MEIQCPQQKKIISRNPKSSRTSKPGHSKIILCSELAMSTNYHPQKPFSSSPELMSSFKTKQAWIPKLAMNLSFRNIMTVSYTISNLIRPITQNKYKCASKSTPYQLCYLGEDEPQEQSQKVNKGTAGW